MPKPTTLISIETCIDTTTQSFGSSFIKSLCDEDPCLVPEKLSTTENYKDPYLGVDDFLSKWWAVSHEVRVDGRRMEDAIQGPMWKRKSSLASRGMVEHGFCNHLNQKIPSALWFECRWASQVDFNHLFEAWVQLCNAELEIAMLHVFTDAESYWQEQEAGRSFRIGSFGNGNRLGPPNIGWAMAYGKGYAHKVDIAKIRAAGFPVDEHDGVIIVRVTESLSDVVNDFPYFSRRRAKLKLMFGSDLFWIKQEPSERAKD